MALSCSGVLTGFSIATGAAVAARRSIRIWTRIAMATRNRLDVAESASVSVVRFRDAKIIDPETIQELGQELFDLIDKDQRHKLVLNFAKKAGRFVVMAKQKELVFGHA